MSFLSNWLVKNNVANKTSELSEIIEVMSEAVIIVNAETQIISSNKLAYDAFARGNGALETKRLTEVFRDLSIHEGFRKAIENKQSCELKFEFSKRFYEVKISPFQDKSIGIFNDITRLEQLENVRQEFLSNVSHELRTPLTSILAFVETLEDGAINDEENNLRFLEIIRKNGERMQHLIEDISELTLIEAGKISIEPKKIKLFALINEIFTNLSAKTENILLKNEIAENVQILADRFRLEQMLTNLIDNAIKFNRPNGSVIVSYKQNETKDLILVEDTGEGIAEEHLPRLFERFYRTDKARSREIGGTGLGLAIVKHLALLHNGEVFVSSTFGKGTIFTIELPK